MIWRKHLFPVNGNIEAQSRGYEPHNMKMEFLCEAEIDLKLPGDF